MNKAKILRLAVSSGAALVRSLAAGLDAALKRHAPSVAERVPRPSQELRAHRSGTSGEVAAVCFQGPQEQEAGDAGVVDHSNHRRQQALRGESAAAAAAAAASVPLLLHFLASWSSKVSAASPRSVWCCSLLALTQGSIQSHACHCMSPEREPVPLNARLPTTCVLPAALGRSSTRSSSMA